MWQPIGVGEMKSTSIIHVMCTPILGAGGWIIDYNIKVVKVLGEVHRFILFSLWEAPMSYMYLCYSKYHRCFDWDRRHRSKWRNNLVVNVYDFKTKVWYFEPRQLIGSDTLLFFNFINQMLTRYRIPFAIGRHRTCTGNDVYAAGPAQQASRKTVCGRPRVDVRGGRYRRDDRESLLAGSRRRRRRRRRRRSRGVHGCIDRPLNVRSDAGAVRDRRLARINGPGRRRRRVGGDTFARRTRVSTGRIRSRYFSFRPPWCDSPPLPTYAPLVYCRRRCCRSGTMGSLPNLHELCEQRSVDGRPVVPPARLSPNPGCAAATTTASAAGTGRGGGGRAQHRRLQQTNSLCTGNFYGVIDRQTDMQINEVRIYFVMYYRVPAKNLKRAIPGVGWT